MRKSVCCESFSECSCVVVVVDECAGLMISDPPHIAGLYRRPDLWRRCCLANTRDRHAALPSDAWSDPSEPCQALTGEGRCDHRV